MKVLKVTQSWHIDYIRANLLKYRKFEEHVQNVNDGLGEVLPISPLDTEERDIIVYEDEWFRRILVTYGYPIQKAILGLYPETEIVER